MIDFSKPSSQSARFTAKNSELYMSYDVINENREYQFDNLVFAYNTQGSKNVDIANSLSINLQPGTVIMGATKFEAKTSLPNASLDIPTVCLVIEISKEKAWKVLEKVNEQYQLPHLIKEERKIDPMDVFHGNGGNLVLNTLKSLQNLLAEDIAFKDYWINLKIEELILCCLQTNMRKVLLEGYSKNSLIKHPLGFAIEYIREHYNTRINIKTLADKACMSKATFFRQFKNHLGMTPITYIHCERMKEGKKLLTMTTESITEISYRLGYGSSSYFSSQFEKNYGCSPKEYRKSLKDII